MNIEILMFKDSGKYYASCNVKTDTDIPLYDDKFKKFIADNLPASINEGYTVIIDKDGGEGFHIVHYKTSELRNITNNNGGQVI